MIELLQDRNLVWLILDMYRMKVCLRHEKLIYRWQIARSFNVLQVFQASMNSFSAF